MNILVHVSSSFVEEFPRSDTARSYAQLSLIMAVVALAGTSPYSVEEFLKTLSAVQWLPT